MREFFGFGGYQRTPEGYMSWQHLAFVTSLMVVMVASAWLLGKRTHGSCERSKNKVLVVSAILIDSLELFKIVLLCFRSQDPMNWIHNLPLFLCSIQLIAIPMAAFCKGRVREAALDFVYIFGLLGAVLGTYFAGQNYGCYPVWSFDNVVSGLTHSISGFCALYIGWSGMVSMQQRNVPYCLGLLLGFCSLSYCINHLVDYNYMFLMRGDGTPYDILFNLLGGRQVAYSISVVALFFVYILGFYAVHFRIACRKHGTYAYPSALTAVKRSVVNCAMYFSADKT